MFLQIEKPNDGRDDEKGKGKGKGKGDKAAPILDNPDPNRTLENMNYKFRKPELPKGMKHVFDIRHGKAIVIAKRDYGNLS